MLEHDHHFPRSGRSSGCRVEGWAQVDRDERLAPSGRTSSHFPRLPFSWSSWSSWSSPFCPALTYHFVNARAPPHPPSLYPFVPPGLFSWFAVCKQGVGGAPSCVENLVWTVSCCPILLKEQQSTHPPTKKIHLFLSPIPTTTTTSGPPFRDVLVNRGNAYLVGNSVHHCALRVSFRRMWDGLSDVEDRDQKPGVVLSASVI